MVIELLRSLHMNCHIFYFFKGGCEIWIQDPKLIDVFGNSEQEMNLCYFDLCSLC